MSRLTAQQARELCIDSVEREVDIVLSDIKSHCKPNLPSHAMTIKNFMPFWATKTVDRDRAYLILRNLGYKVQSIHEKTGGFRSDINDEPQPGTSISWIN
jgi:hypothetical protein